MSEGRTGIAVRTDKSVVNTINLLFRRSVSSCSHKVFVSRGLIGMWLAKRNGAVADGDLLHGCHILPPALFKA